MKKRNLPRWVASLARVSVLFCLMLGISACGYSEEEWQAQIDKYNRLVAEHQSTGDRLAQTEQQLQAANAMEKTTSRLRTLTSFLDIFLPPCWNDLLSPDRALSACPLQSGMPSPISLGPLHLLFPPFAGGGTGAVVSRTTSSAGKTSVRTSLRP